MPENATKIEIPLTSEGILAKKGAVETLKKAFKNNIASKITEDECAVNVMLLEQVKGMKFDVQASKNVTETYDKLTLDDMNETTSLDMSNYRDLNSMSGNFAITSGLKSEIRREVEESLGEASQVTSEEEVGGVFGDDRTREPIDAKPDVIGLESGVEPSSQASHSKRYGGRYNGELFKNCIPCSSRSQSIKPLKDIGDMLMSDLVGRYNRVLDNIDRLFTNNEIHNDLCSLLNYLNFQCVPDIKGMISVLNMMILKLTDTKLVNPTGFFMSILSPFFAPLLNGISGLLDKYIQLILGPIDCHIRSIDTILSRLDGNEGVNAAKRAELAQLSSQRASRTSQIDGLRERRKFLTQVDDNGGFVNNPADHKIRNIDGQQENVNLGANTVIGQHLRSREDEIQTIDRRIDRLENEKLQISRRMAELQEEEPGVSLSRQARDAIREQRQALGGGLQDLRRLLQNGSNMIDDSAAALRKELQRLIFGRAVTSDEMIQGAMEIQRIARLIGLLGAMRRLVNRGELCNNNNDPSTALGGFLSSARTGNLSANQPNFYTGTDSEGDQVLLVASSDAIIELQEEGSSESEKLRNKDEINELNERGEAFDIGSIANKTVTASVPDLDTEAPVSIMKFNLCGDPTIATAASITQIEGWAENIGN
jgi:hypothetical protein